MMNLETDIIKEVPAEVTNDGEIVVGSIITQLKLLGYNLDESEIWFYTNDYQEYVYCETDPISRVIIAKQTDLNENTIKLRADLTTRESKVFEMDDKIEEDTKGDKKDIDAKGDDSKISRVKERELAVIIHKVKKWRDLYRGYIGQDGKRIKYSLEDAAKQVHLPKKTLDDYLQQLKMGKRYGFDFNANKSQKIGTLREFVKTHKKQKVNDDSNMEIDENN